MPELAEVETVRRTLKERILNNKILDIDAFYKNIIENDIDYFKDNLIGKSFIDIKRRGKFLIFETENNYLISHLRMEGKYFIKTSTDEINKHEHVIFHCKSFDLRYHDTRKFGRMKLIDKDKLEDYFKDLGPDANLRFDPKIVYDKIHKSNLAIKTLLLDQNIIAGLGNIYVDEVLFLSKINPFKKGKDISLKDVKSILESSKKVLDKAIECKGTTIRTYTSSLGVYGEYQNYLKVHTKKICECGNDISVDKIGGRTTYYCKKCQK